jgi:NTE family protein
MLHADEWPELDTWIPAVNLGTGELTVFGRDHHAPVAVADAVAASCAIPGFFKPVRINGQRFVDGGVRSMVNADLLADLGLDLVVALSPMSAESISARRPVAAVLRSYPRMQLRRELRIVEEWGTATLCIEPDASVTRSMGANPMDPTSVVPVLTATSVATSVELAKPEHTDLLTLLQDAGTLLESPVDVPYPE